MIRDKSDFGLAIIGASLAGLRAAEAAREHGFSGQITMVGSEPYIPYDRPPLSKAFINHDELTTEFRPHKELTEELGLTLLLGEPATNLDITERLLQVGNREVPFSSAVIATGAKARVLPLGAGLEGVHTLRTLDDARKIRCALQTASNVIVIGAGFIGSEIASSAVSRGAHVTIVEMAPIPLTRVIGESLGQAVASLHTRNGTDLLCGVSVDEIYGNASVSGVRLSDGTDLAADLVVVGAGATPATDWLEQSGLEIDNGIVCDATLNVGTPGIYAAGDVARWPNPLFKRTMRLEHWTNAAEQGAHAGRAAIDPKSRTAFSTVPYFWSDLYDSRIQGLGLTSGEMHVLEGDLDEGRFVTGFREGDSIVGVLSLNMPHRIMKYRRFLGSHAGWQDALDFAPVTV